jgi:hypothetical protein
VSANGRKGRAFEQLAAWFKDREGNLKIDEQIDRAACGNPLLGMRRCITQQPKTLDASVEWGDRRSGTEVHTNKTK